MAEDKTPKRDDSEVEDSHIEEAINMIEQMAKDGTLRERIVALPYERGFDLDTDDHPELKNEKIGAPVVVIIGGIVTRLPKPKGKDTSKDVPMAVGGRDSVGLTMYEVAVVHGNMGATEKTAEKSEREGRRSPRGLAARIGSKKLA